MSRSESPRPDTSLNISLTSQKSARKIYRPLTGHQIRLLVLHPSTIPDALIECSLRTVTLSEGSDVNPEFEALSYAWGDPHVTERIALENEPFDVALSIYGALKHLRHDNESRILWVDVVCINQIDLHEREQQVLRMRDVYRLASRVPIWLGPCTDQLKAAFDITRRIDDWTTNNNANYDGVYISIKSLRALSALLELPWWHRLWCCQEAVLAQEVVLQLGHERFGFQSLFNSITVAMNLPLQLEEGDTIEDLRTAQITRIKNQGGIAGLTLAGSIFGKKSDPYRELYRKLFLTGHTSESKAKVMMWIFLANSLRLRQCSIPHDRVYALYGLLPPELLEVPALAPSYSSGLREVFTRTTYAIIKASECLAMLNFVDRDRSPEKTYLPSWVPDWSVPGTSSTNLNNNRVKTEIIFNASLNSPFIVKLGANDTLGVHGVVFDTVESTGTEVNSVLSYKVTPDLPMQLIAFWKTTRAYQMRLSQGVSKKTMRNAFQRTLIGDCRLYVERGGFLPERIAPDVDPKVLTSVWQTWQIGNDDDEEDDHDPKNEGQTPLINKINLGVSNKYVWNCLANKTPIVTTKGFFGMAECNVRPGDHIFIVSGNSHPVILRPSDKFKDTYTAVSECYIHGFMDGQALQDPSCVKRTSQEEELLFAPLKSEDVSPLSQKYHSPCNPCFDEFGGAGDLKDGWQWLFIE